MDKKGREGEEEWAKLQVPDCPLSDESAPTAPYTPSGVVSASGGSGGAAPVAKTHKLRERLKPYPVAGSRPGYYSVLEDIERRRARERRRTLRLAEAAKRRRQHLIVAVLLALIASLGFGFVVFSRFV